MGEEIKDTAFGMLPADMQTKLYKELIERQKKYVDEIETLKRAVDRQDKVIEALATEGIDIRMISPISEVAPFLQFEHPEELEVLKSKNKGEFLRRIVSRYFMLMNEKRRSFEDEQLDLDGNAVYDQLKKVHDFTTTHLDPILYTPEDISEHKKAFELYNVAFPRLVKWQKLDADMMNIPEATINLVLHYAVNEVKDNAKVKVSTVATDYEKQLAEQEIPEQPTPPATPIQPPQPDKLSRLEQNVAKQNDVLERVMARINELYDNLQQPEPSPKTPVEPPETPDSSDNIDEISYQSRKKTAKK